MPERPRPQLLADVQRKRESNPVKSIVLDNVTLEIDDTNLYRITTKTGKLTVLTPLEVREVLTVLSLVEAIKANAGTSG